MSDLELLTLLECGRTAVASPARRALLIPYRRCPRRVDDKHLDELYTRGLVSKCEMLSLYLWQITDVGRKHLVELRKEPT